MATHSIYHPDKKSGTYSRPIHHRELVTGAIVHNEAPPVLRQDLLAKEGINLAIRSLQKTKRT